MPDAVIYARYSSHNQRDASIDDQVRVCREAAERAGDRVVAVYADRARSGREVTKRAEFLRMIEDAKDAGWRRVYLYKTDRFARNRYDAAIYRSELKKRGVSIVAVMEPAVEGAEGILMEALAEGMAEYYSANLSENVRRGLEGNALQCKHNGCKLFGYALGSDGLYHVNEAEAPLVRKVFAIYADGGDAGDAARALANRRTPNGAKWTKQRIIKMIKNEKYAGTYVFGGHRVPGGMEAIVSPETWERANAGLGGRHANKADYPLSGRLYDGEGRRFTGARANGNGGVYLYYQVRETGERYPKETVEAAVYEAVGTFLAETPGLVDGIADAVMAAQSDAYGDEAREAESMRARIAEIDREADAVVDAIAKLGAQDRLTRKLSALEDEAAGIRSDLADLERSAPKLSREAVEAMLGLVVAARAPMEVVASFVERIVIDGDAMTVTFRISEGIAGKGDETADQLAVRPVTSWLAGGDSGRTYAVSAGASCVVLAFAWR